MVEASEEQAVRNDKEINFANLRKKSEIQASEIARLQSELEESRAAIGSFQSLKESGVDPDAFVEGKHVAKILSAESKKGQKALEDRLEAMVNAKLKEYSNERAFTYLQAETQGQFSKVVTEEAFNNWSKAQPLLSKAVSDIPDPLERGAAMMQALSAFQDTNNKIKATEEKLQHLHKTGNLNSLEYTMAVSNGKPDNEHIVRNFTINSKTSDSDRSTIWNAHNEFINEKGIDAYMKIMHEQLNAVDQSGAMSYQKRG